MRRLARLTAVFFSTWQLATAGILILKLAWVEEFKNRATIDANFIIDHAHKTPNAAAADGDMHVAGRAAKEVGLPMVAEVVNARSPEQKAALDLIHLREGKDIAVPMSGAWRVWFEHPGERQVQFQKVDKPGNTNPDHNFEIHPVTKVGDELLLKSFRVIPGFTPKPAKTAFEVYNKQEILIRATKTAITLEAKKVGFNYTAFRMRLIGKPKKLKDDGLAVLADVHDESEDEDALAVKIRMIFVAGTRPWELVQGKDDGDEFDAIGIPRVDLAQIASFAANAGPAGVRRKLPYEMIIVAAGPVK